MGRDAVTLHAYASVSRHNSEQDDRDNQAWNDFVYEVRAAAERSPLFIDVWGEYLPITGWKELP